MSRKVGRRSVVVIVFIAIAVLFWGIGRWPTGPAHGGPIVPLSSATQPSTAPPRSLRLATFNIHSGIGLDDKRDLPRISRALKGFDLIAMQEVSGDRPWRNNQVTDIAKLLNLTGIFLPTETHFWYPIFGNGVMTDTTITTWSRTPLPSGYHMAHRNMLQLAVPFGDGTLTVLIAHMGKKSDRARQFAVVSDLFKTLPTPAVLMGDLNTRPTEPMMESLLKFPDVHDEVGERIKPVDRVDFIITHGVHCRDAGLVENDASDHPVAWAELEADK